MLTPTELDEITGRLGMATPGHWRWASWDTEFGIPEPGDIMERRTLERGAGDDPIVPQEDEPVHTEILTRESGNVRNVADLLFIAHASTDMLRLLKDRDELTFTIARLCAEVADLKKRHHSATEKMIKIAQDAQVRAAPGVPLCLRLGDYLVPVDHILYAKHQVQSDRYVDGRQTSVVLKQQTRLGENVSIEWWGDLADELWTKLCAFAIGDA